MILLKTERLILRRFTAADADHLYTLDNDPEVMRFLNGGTPTPMAIIKKEILPRFLTYDDRRPVFGFWAAVEKASGDFIGWFSLRLAVDNPAEAILGYRLLRSVWGKGYATEGVQALIAKGFSESELQRITATTYEDNIASRRVMEKVGMTHVRSFRLTPEDLLHVDTSHLEAVEVWDGDDVEYALEKVEWNLLTSFKSPLAP